MRTPPTCVICGQFTTYLARQEGTVKNEPPGTVLTISKGDPVCLNHFVMRKDHPKQYVEVDVRELWEPGKETIAEGTTRYGF